MANVKEQPPENFRASYILGRRILIVDYERAIDELVASGWYPGTTDSLQCRSLDLLDQLENEGSKVSTRSPVCTELMEYQATFKRFWC